MFISNGWTCDVVLVVAVTDRQAKSAAHGISLFLVDADTPGFRKRCAPGFRTGSNEARIRLFCEDQDSFDLGVLFSPCRY